MRNSRRAGKPAGKKPEKQSLLGLFTKGKNIPTTAQQTLPYREMYRDGVCRVADRYYTCLLYTSFSKFGACEKEMLCHVRPPRDDEKKNS